MDIPATDQDTAIPEYLTGKLLVAMPYLRDPRFAQSVIYLCGHDSNGAMGLIINQLFTTITFEELFKQLEIPLESGAVPIPLHYGGPVEIGRGFVLHSDDFMHESTVLIRDHFALTATLDVLRAVVAGRGPKHILLALGYAGWGAGQLEQEIQQNGWLPLDATFDLVFKGKVEDKWLASLATIGVDPAGLSLESGHA